MTGEPLDELYFQWLYGQVCVTKRSTSRSRTYWTILRQLFTKEFVWIVPNDDNRVEDGRDLRIEFEESLHIRADREWMELGCSMLEMLIGLSRRLSFETGREPRGWFWHLLGVLHLDEYPDDKPVPTQEVDEILDAVIWRTYAYNGEGGLFPLKHPEKDQRLVEIWYQLSAYLLERIR